MRAAIAAVCIALAESAWAQAPAGSLSSSSAASSELLARAGVRVADYYSRARTVLSRETVRLQPLDRQLRPSGDWRRLVYDTRVEWDPARPGEASISREPVSAGGRLGELAASDAECYNLKGVSVEPLAILLPHRQKDYAFVEATGDGDSPAAIFDFKPLQATPPTVKWRGNCATIELNGHTTGRVWIDRGTAAVLRMDERLTRRFSFLTPNARAHRGPIAQDVDRAEVSVRYEPIRFADPDETVMLPVSIRSLWVINNSGMPQLLTLHSYGAYRRFTTGGRVVK